MRMMENILPNLSGEQKAQLVGRALEDFTSSTWSRRLLIFADVMSFLKILSTRVVGTGTGLVPIDNHGCEEWRGSMGYHRE